VHAFRYPLFFACIDLDELPSLMRSPLFNGHRSTLFSIQTADHLDFGAATIRANLAHYLNSLGITEKPGKISLLTQLRTAGYLFNPVSFFFVSREDGSPWLVVAEVANTFHEQKLYVIENKPGASKGTSAILKKHFYISPFSDLDTQLHFHLRFPGDRLRLRIGQSDEEGLYFDSTVIGERLDWTQANLARMALRYPMAPLKAMIAIHWHALMLLIKGVPVRAKGVCPELQKNTRPYLPRKLSNAHRAIPS
jgi:DUF1365 family protein